MEKGWDFFLQAYTVLGGTAKPTHYVVILDENGMNADGLEALVSSSKLGPAFFPLLITINYSRRTTSAIFSVERQKQSRYVLLHTMPICSPNAAERIYTENSTLGITFQPLRRRLSTGFGPPGWKAFMLR